MLNSNNKTLRQSLQRTKKSQKNIHTASINLKEASCSQAIYLPLREVLQRKISDNVHNNSSKNKSKIIDRSIYLMDKSFSASKKNNKENKKIDIRQQNKQRSSYRYKIVSKQNKPQTDRKSLHSKHDKSAKALRLRTDYHDNTISQGNLYQAMMSKQQVSTKQTDQQISRHTQSNSAPVVYISRQQLQQLYDACKNLNQNNMKLKKQLEFYQKPRNIPEKHVKAGQKNKQKIQRQKGYKNSILKALQC